MPLLKSAQASNMLGEAIAWFAPKVCGQVNGWQYTQTPEKIKIEVLRLQEKQMIALDDALFVNTVEQQTLEADSSLLQGKNSCEIYTLLNQKISQGKAKGLNSHNDLSLFVILSLQIPQVFESKSPISQALVKTVKEKITFAKALEQVPSKEWEVLE